MKKTSKLSSNLKLKITKIMVLSPEQLASVAAGGDGSIKTQPSSFACIPPFNAPPYFYTTKD